MGVGRCFAKSPRPKSSDSKVNTNNLREKGTSLVRGEGQTNTWKMEVGLVGKVSKGEKSDIVFS